MNLPLRVAVAVAVGWAVTAAGYATGPPPAPALGPGPVTVLVDIEHSEFRPAHLRVAQGTSVRFVVANRDPINHELIVGPAAVHERHSRGTEAEHPPVPGEVSVGPGERGVTTFTFDTPGDVVMACHLPGHLEYGMRGKVEVVPAAAQQSTRQG